MVQVERTTVTSNEAPQERIGLVGCVKSKGPTRARARDLYVSPLFRGRRCYVERTCSRWYVLSARHGLVDPIELLDPYDESLTNASSSRRRDWGDAVLNALDDVVVDHREVTYEIHAGAAYRDHGLVDGLRSRGAAVEIPAKGLSQGEQRAFYAPCLSAEGSVEPQSTAPSRQSSGVRPSGSPPEPRTPSAGQGGKYAALGMWLHEAGSATTSVTFTTIERIIGGQLPASARRHRAWWANESSHSQAAAWLAAGWAVDRVDMASGTVRFGRRTHG